MLRVRVAVALGVAASFQLATLSSASANSPAGNTSTVVASATTNTPAEPSTAPATASNPLAAAIAMTAAKSLAPPAPPAATLQVKIDLATQTATIITDNKTLHTWKISSGTAEFATPRGVFQPQWMAKMWFSKKYDDAPMPHSVFFKDGVAMHATQAVHALGRPASHGCVRLAPANAATFYALVQKHGMKHTRIHVFGTPNFAPKVAQKQPAARQQFAAPAYAPKMYPTYGYYPQPQKQTYLLDGLFSGSPAPQPVYRPYPQQVRVR